MSKTFRNDIISHLIKKGNYESSVDDYLVDILIDNVKFSEELKAIVKSEGIIVTIPNGNGIPTTKENPAFGSYLKCLSMINVYSIKLGISRKDRIALKLIEEKNKDEFDEDFGS
jgi:hypothetical protein